MDSPCFSSRFCPETSHCHHLLAFFPSCILVPGEPGTRMHMHAGQGALLHGPVLMLMFSLSLWVVHRVQHRHHVWSAACIHNKLTILTSFYKDQFLGGNVSYSSSPVGLDHTGTQTVSPCASLGMWHCRWFSTVPLQTGNSFGHAIVQSSSHHNLPFVKLA